MRSKNVGDWHARQETSEGPLPRLLSVKQVCALLNRSRARVYEMVRTHELGHLKDGRSILIPPEALEEWIRKKRRQSGC